MSECLVLLLYKVKCRCYFDLKNAYNPVKMTTLETQEKKDVESLHKEFTHYGQNARIWMRKCELLLPEINANRVWESKGFSSIYEYAAKLAGMSSDKVDDCLRILKRIKDEPELMRVAQEKGVGAVRPVITIARPESANFWAKKAREMGKHTLTTYVKEYRKTLDDAVFGDPESSQSVMGLKCANLNDEKVEIAMKLKPEIANRLKKMANGNWDALMEEFLALKQDALERVKPEPAKTNSRHIPVAIQNFVLARSCGMCEFDACSKQFSSFHHAERFSLKKLHDPDKIFALCREHHNLMHYGLVENEESGPSAWKIKEDRHVWDEGNASNLKNDTNNGANLKLFVDQKMLAYLRPG